MNNRNLFKTLVISDPTKKKTPPALGTPVQRPVVGQRPAAGAGAIPTAQQPAGGQPAAQRPRVNITQGNEGTIMTRDMPFEFGVIRRAQIMYMSHEELLKTSISITNEEDKNGIITQNTISDPRMGPIERNKPCAMPGCGLSKNHCPGHLGRIDLVVPIAKRCAYDYIIYVLQSVCWKCFVPLLDIDTLKSGKYSSGPNRLKEIAADSAKQYCRNIKCKFVNGFNPEIKTKPGKMTSIDTMSSGVAGSLSMSNVVKIFDAITEPDLVALGFENVYNKAGELVYKIHPTNFIFISLPVIPECNRPTIVLSDGREETDHLTDIYTRIVETNNILKEAKLTGNISGRRGDATLEELDLLISSLLTSNDDKPKPGNMDSVGTIKGKMSKKKGYFRCHAMGKRGNRTARSMLGSMSLPFGYLGVPDEITEYVTMTERVCDKNIEYLSKLLAEGRIPFFINSRNGLNNTKKMRNAHLEVGNVVWRYLENGDPIVFNRQPTLYKQSMMGYLVKKRPEKSVGLHSSNTKVHNADFDGDEGNMYITPSYEARAEIMYIAGCWNNIIAPQFSRPVIGLEYNAVTASYLISRYGVFTDAAWEEGLATLGRFQDRVTGVVGSNGLRFPGLLERGRRFYNETNLKSGPMMFSALLPQDFYYSKAGVLIINGILTKGTLTKKHVGASSGSIVHKLYHHYGTDVAARFISEAQIMLDWFIEKRGFTVSYGDCSVSEAEAAKIKEIVEAEMDAAKLKILKLGLPDPSASEVELNFREESFQAALDTVTNIGTEVMKSGLSEDNNLRVMAVSGAKGKVDNIAQITGIIGQQFFLGKRPPLIYNTDKHGRGRRFLPYYDVEPVGANGDILNRGFVDRDFNQGMRPGQYFAHLMSSRTGLINTALGTAVTGHLNRTINKTLEDVRLAYNGTVCKENGGVVQYMFGPDGYDPKALVETTCPATGLMWSPVDIPNLVAKLNAEVEYPM